MTTGIVIMVVVVLVAMAALGLLWDSWRSGRAFCTPIPRPFRNRDSQEVAWQDRYGERLSDADAVLRIFCEASVWPNVRLVGAAPELSPPLPGIQATPGVGHGDCAVLGNLQQLAKYGLASFFSLEICDGTVLMKGFRHVYVRVNLRSFFKCCRSSSRRACLSA